MKNLTIETRQSKAGNDYKFISGEGTYYLSALKKARNQEQTELIDVPIELAEFTKHLLYNRVLQGFVIKVDSWDIVSQGLDALTIPDNWKDMVKKILPKANIFKSDPPKSKVKATKVDNNIVSTLVAKLDKYDTWGEIPANSIKKINEVCEAEGIKIAQVRKAFVPKTVSKVDDLEF